MSTPTGRSHDGTDAAGPGRVRHVRRRIVALGAAAAAAAIVVTAAGGCAGAAPPTRTLSTDTFLGRPFGDLDTQLTVWPGIIGRPQNFGVLTYNVSPGVLGRPVPGLPDPAATPDLSGRFRIVALCFNGARSEIAVGVIPEATVTPRILDRARAHAYDRDLQECPGTGSVFTVTAPVPAPMPTHQR